MAIEDTMAQLAHSQVTQSLPSLTTDIQGFQLIYSNEDINSAIGVLVAVVNNLVVYIPAVYRKGKIYNMDVMYIPELRQWLPTQDNWVTYIRSKRADIEAIVRDRDVVSRGGSASSVNLDTPLLKMIKHASDVATRASDIEVYGIPTILKQASDFMEKALETPVPNLFIPSATQLMIKTASSATTQTLVDSVAEHPAVANSFAQFYSDADMLAVVKAADDALNMLSGNKTHKNADEGEVRVLTSASSEAKSLTDEEKATILRDGAVIKDTRGLVPTKVYKTKTRGAWSCPSTTGMYELLKLDGSTMTGMVIVNPTPKITMDRGDVGNCCLVIPVDDGKAHYAHLAPKTILGQLIPIQNMELSGGKTTSTLVGGISRAVVLDVNGSALFLNGINASHVSGEDTPAVYVGDHCRVGRSFSWSDNHDDKIHKIVEIPARGKLRVSDGTLYVPKTAKYFSMPSFGEDYNDLKLATSDEFIDTITKREKLLAVKVYTNNDLVVVSDEQGRETEPLSKNAAAYDLVKNYVVPVDVALSMVKEASEARQARYLLKIATSSALSVAMTDGDPRQIDNQSVDLNGHVTDGEDPVKVIQEAGSTGVKEIMDVTVLKMLAEDNSCVRMIQDMLPQLFGAMNAVGQLLFMTRASTSMSDAYGETRTDEMEKQFSILLQRLGDAVIALQRGRVDDISDLLEGRLSSTLG